ncbi:hypothetical protein GIB67_040740, partial [Kingdonia uniflora]
MPTFKHISACHEAYDRACLMYSKSKEYYVPAVHMPRKVPKHDRKSPVCRSILGGFLAKFETQVSMFSSVLDVLQHWNLKTSSTIAGLQDFQKNFTVQISCAFCGMKT